MRVRRWVAGAVALAAAVSVPPVLATSSTPTASAAVATAPHVFVIVLENKTYEVTFGPDSPAPYLAHTLPAQGALLRQYHGIGHVSLDNYIAMVSGQAPNPQTQSDCQLFTDFVSLTGGALDGDGQAVGTGCVYPTNVRTVADQLESAGFTWKGYMEDMGTPCRHPELNARDETQSAKVGDQYAARHNPFVYFHSIIDDPARCAAHVVDLKALPTDLASADAFLKEWVPRITSSPAFRRNGVLIVTFDEAEVGDAATDTRACCHEPTGPNTLLPGIVGPGGGRTGTVVLGPDIRPGTVSDEPYNHYSLLRTFEDLFGLTHLGFAGQAGLRSFGSDVFTAG